MKNLNYLMCGPTIVLTIIMSSSEAQNKISLLRFEDDYSYLKNDILKKGLERLKYVSLRNKNYISFGGELREQFQMVKNINFGDVAPNFKDISANQLWHRLMLHSNIELGDHVRLFIQLNYTLGFFNNNPVVPEIDENQLSLHQAFAELKLKQWEDRLGRQELFYGNHRVLTVREGPNTRQAFDGLVIKSKFKNGVIDFIALSKVISKQYVFDDQSFKEGLIGIYGTQLFSNGELGLDYYPVNFQSKLRKYNYQSGFENRQTNGLRSFSKFNKINFEMEGAYQSGKFNDLTIAPIMF